MDLNASRLSAYSRLFSTAVFREMAAKGRSALFARLLHETSIREAWPKLRLVSDAFEAAFNVLREKPFRDEYVYKAALTHKVLLGTHSIRSASMLTEFRVGECKADLVILNGTATVYEIKSERDKLTRLSKQIEEYKKVFSRVFVIAGEAHVDEILRMTSKDVGVLQLSQRHQISTIRDGVDRPDLICPVSVFESIRVSEASQILEILGISTPEVPNTRLRAEMRMLFERINPLDVHSAMIRVLKKSRSLEPLSDLVDSLPPSLQAAALSVSLKKSDHERLIKAVNTDLQIAMNWA